jgi:hypothetical protein
MSKQASAQQVFKVPKSPNRRSELSDFDIPITTLSPDDEPSHVSPLPVDNKLESTSRSRHGSNINLNSSPRDHIATKTQRRVRFSGVDSRLSADGVIDSMQAELVQTIEAENNINMDNLLKTKLEIGSHGNNVKELEEIEVNDVSSDEDSSTDTDLQPESEDSSDSVSDVINSDSDSASNSDSDVSSEPSETSSDDESGQFGDGSNHSRQYRGYDEAEDGTSSFSVDADDGTRVASSSRPRATSDSESNDETNGANPTSSKSKSVDVDKKVNISTNQKKKVQFADSEPSLTSVQPTSAPQTLVATTSPWREKLNDWLDLALNEYDIGLIIELLVFTFAAFFFLGPLPWGTRDWKCPWWLGGGL